MVTFITSANDKSSSKIIHILIFKFGLKIKRINTDTIKNITIDITKDLVRYKIEYNYGSILTTLDKIIFYRRSNLFINPDYFYEGVHNNSLTSLLYNEWNAIRELLFDKIKNNSLLGGYFQESKCRKLLDLSLAIKCKLRVPNTIVTSTRSELLKFFKKFNATITKPINEHINIIESNFYYHGTGTQLVDRKFIECLNENFHPVLLQEYIEKIIEIRVFIFNNNIYSMAIFSQGDEKTKIDYRNYNDSKPNRMVPYNLPHKLEIKLLKFIKLAGLDTGSIDLIYSKDEKYYFLEINPCGQFDWVSHICNYNIEFDLAKFIYDEYEKKINKISN